MSRFIERKTRWSFADCDSIGDHSIAAQNTDSCRARSRDEISSIRLAHQIRGHRQALRAFTVGTTAVEINVRVEIRSRGNSGSAVGGVAQNRDPITLKSSAKIWLEAYLVNVVKVGHEQT